MRGKGKKRKKNSFECCAAARATAAVISRVFMQSGLIEVLIKSGAEFCPNKDAKQGELHRKRLPHPANTDTAAPQPGAGERQANHT